MSSLIKMENLEPIILSSFEESLSRLSGIKSETLDDLQVTGSTEYSCLVNGDCARSDYDSELGCNPYKKRKTVQAWTEQVHVCEKTGLQGPIADGYSWKKYGQKDILGAKHPRGYFRCAHRTAHGCLAMKQVQRSDEDTSIFNVLYRGKHTCIQDAHLLPGQSVKGSVNITYQQNAKRLKKSQETITNFKSGCHVKSKNSGTSQTLLRSPSTSIPCIEKESNNDIFSSMGSSFSSPYLLAPATSESSSFSPCRVQDLHTSDYDICELTSTVTSAFDSTDVYFDFGYFDGL
ncbi:hypothetical protein MKX03_006408 [Papaver bracteatum]|nr:hypothetical protein MKX03_006408 [Papaver bracteatum]